MFTKEILIAIKNKLSSLPKDLKITAVNVALSPLSHVKPETLTETFTATTKSTEFEKITLHIKVLQLGIKCRSCKQGFMIDKPVMRCSSCNSADLDIVYNREFVVESIETAKI